MNWNDIVSRAPEYGFLGGIVGIAGLMLGAGSAILYATTRTFADWRPPKDGPLHGLEQTVGALCAVGIIVAWIFATPDNVVDYIHIAIKLVIGGAVAFVLYIGLRVVVASYRKPMVGANNQPTGKTETIWGGFWLTKPAREAVKNGIPKLDQSGHEEKDAQGQTIMVPTTVAEYLEGNIYIVDRVWPRGSQALAAMSGAIVLMAMVVGISGGVSTAATAAQVVLTRKPARDVFKSTDVPGLPPPNSVAPAPAPTSKASATPN
jgi:hypothetical protein